jgi:hypothetical protein
MSTNPQVVNIGRLAMLCLAITLGCELSNDNVFTCELVPA